MGVQFPSTVGQAKMGTAGFPQVVGYMVTVQVVSEKWGQAVGSQGGK